MKCRDCHRGGRSDASVNRVVVGVAAICCSLGCGAKTSPPELPVVDMTCATAATPDVVLTFAPPGDSSIVTSASADYGSKDCPNQYLVEIVLPTRSGLYLSGTWGVSPSLRSACDYTATMTAFGLRSGASSWEIDDQVKTHGMLTNGVCTTVVDARLNALPSEADPTAPHGYVNPDRYDRVRAAVRAMDGSGADVPVLIDYFYPTP